MTDKCLQEKEGSTKVWTIPAYEKFRSSIYQNDNTTDTDERKKTTTDASTATRFETLENTGAKWEKYALRTNNVTIYSITYLSRNDFNNLVCYVIFEESGRGRGNNGSPIQQSIQPPDLKLRAILEQDGENTLHTDNGTR